MNHLKLPAFYVLIMIYHSSEVFGVDHPDELSEGKVVEKYTFSTKKEDWFLEGCTSIVIPGTKNPENGNDTVIKVAIKVERAAKVLRSLTSVKSPVTEEIVVHRRLNSKYKNCLQRHISRMFYSCTYEKRPAIIMPHFGESLFEYQKKHNFKPLPHQMFRRLASHLLTAIKSTHEAGYLHHDLHFKNVAFGLESEPLDGKTRLEDVTYNSDFYLIDFGNAVKYLDENKRHIPRKMEGDSRRDEMLSIGMVLLSALVHEMPDYSYYTPYPRSSAIVTYISKRGVQDVHILKDVENYFDTLAKDLYAGDFRKLYSEASYSQTPKYEMYFKIFA